MTFAIGEHVRIVELGTGQLGRVVVIRQYRTLCPGIRWPCYEHNGEVIPLNPQWIVATSAKVREDIEQLPLFA